MIKKKKLLNSWDQVSHNISTKGNTITNQDFSLKEDQLWMALLRFMHYHLETSKSCWCFDQIG